MREERRPCRQPRVLVRTFAAAAGGAGCAVVGLYMSAAQASPSPADARAVEVRRKAAAGESYMQLLQMIFYEKNRIAANESTLMQHEQDAIRGITASTRMHALGYGCATGLMVGGLMRAINPSAFRVRHRFWAWVAPSVAWGALQGMQTGVRTSTVTLLNLPESPFADRLVTHLEKHIPDSPLLQEVSPTRKRANWGIDAGPEAQRQADTGGSELAQTEAALGVIAVSRQQRLVKPQPQPVQQHEDRPRSLGSAASEIVGERAQDPHEHADGSRWMEGDRAEDSPWAPLQSGDGSDFFGNVYGRAWSAGGPDDSGDLAAYGQGGDDTENGLNRDNIALSTATGPEGRAARMAARKAERERREREIALRRRNEKRAASGERSWIEKRDDTTADFPEVEDTQDRSSQNRTTRQSW